MEPTHKDEKPPQNPWGVALSVGTQLAVSVVLGVVVGRWLDTRWGTQPWLALVGALSGIGLGLYQLIRETATLGKK